MGAGSPKASGLGLFTGTDAAKYRADPGMGWDGVGLGLGFACRCDFGCSFGNDYMPGLMPILH